MDTSTTKNLEDDKNYYNVKIEVEANYGNNVAASTGNASSTSEASTSGDFKFLNPFLSSTNATINKRPPPRIIDIIFLDDDEINPEYEDETPLTTNDKPESEFRSVDPELYQKAYTKKGKKGRRLIVFEDTEKNLIRQYAGNRNNYWFCIGCFSKSKKHVRAFFENEIFVVPKLHFCDPFSYEEAKKEQNEIRKKCNINENELAVDEEKNEGCEENSIRYRLRSRSRTRTPDAGESSVHEENSIRSRLRSRTPTGPIYRESSSETEIGTERYIFGVGASNQKNGRIFVFDDVDKNYGYEFSRSTNSSYYCRSCFSLDKNEKKRWLKVGENGLQLPVLKHICNRILYADVQKEQQRIKTKKGSVGSKKIRRPKRIQKKVVSANFGAANSVAVTSGADFPGPSRRRAQIPIDSFDAFFSQKPASILSGEKDSFSSTQNTCRPPRSSSRTPAYRNSPPPSSVAAEVPESSRTLLLTIPRLIPQTSPSSQATYSKAPIRRRNTPDASVSQVGVKRKVGSQQKNIDSGAVKRKKSAEIDHDSGESDEKYEEGDGTLVFDERNSLNVDKNESQNLTNPLIPASSNDSRPVSSTPSSTPIPSGLSDYTTTVKWPMPSVYILRKCCAELDLVYTREVYNIWMQIEIDKISPTSIPENVFATNEEIYFGWECISLFFTGREDKAGYIWKKVNKHVYCENSKSTIPIDRESEKKVLFSESITEAHLKSISSMFECRIGIFADNKWTRYGNWSTVNSDILTLLMEKKDEKYFLVLSLK